MTFKLTGEMHQTITALYSFGSPGTGMYPYAGLVVNSAGVLYGTNSFAGSNGYGDIFKLTGSGFVV